MMKTKPVYNYDLDQVNALFKRGVFPIGIGVNNKTGNTYVVFKANMRYFDTLKLIEYEQKETKENTNAWVTTKLCRMYYSKTQFWQHKNVDTYAHISNIILNQ